MNKNALTSLIYGLTAVAFSVLFIGRASTGEMYTNWSRVLAGWFVACLIPLLFVFTYPRFLYAASSSQRRRRFAALTHLIAAAAATAFFAGFGPFRQNPMHDMESILLLVALFSIVCLCLISAMFLLLKGESSLAAVAALLIWPYWVSLALLTMDRFFQGTAFQSASYFLSFITPVLFAFAAGAVSYRPKIAHVAAVMGLVSAPWLYRNVMTDTVLGNIWLIFNVPSNELEMFSHSDLVYALFAILCVALLALAVSTAALRLLHSKWRLRGSPIGERTWPAVTASSFLVAVWFCESVTPYRIPGAVDYSDYPFLQILHVEKYGLQFHERCVSVWGGVNRPMSVSFSWDDRRLFDFQFEQKHASGGELPESLNERVQALRRQKDGRREPDRVKPIRAWNADVWYVNAGSGLRI